MFKFEKGIGDAGEKLNSMADGRTLRYQSTVKMKDGRVFWLKTSVINDSIGKHMVILESISGRKYNVNLNNGIAYSTTLR